MKKWILSLALVAFATAQDDACEVEETSSLVTSQSIQDDISLSAIVEHLVAWETFSNTSAELNRRVGTEGHNWTLDYIVEKLEETGYYDIEKHPFSAELEIFSDAELTVPGYVSADNTTPDDYDEEEDGYYLPAGGIVTSGMRNSKNGTFEGLKLVWINSYGCNSSSEWPEEVAGNIGLISRGPAADTNITCTFASKSANAGQAGAVGLIVYDHTNLTYPLQGTLGDEEPAEGPTIPTMGIKNVDGLALVEKIKAGEELVVDFYTESRLADVFSYNIIASTKEGDADNVVFLGAHSDSVQAGPGINDNGSGSAGILEVALQLAKYSVGNQVRFGWWTAEEFGLLGSEAYVAELTPEERMKIRLYLNFDMIGSGNGILARYDGDGSAFNLTGPAGSDQLEHMWEDYYASVGLPLLEVEFSGRSDYGPFMAVNVPSGGLFTGGDGIKTAEEVALFGGEADMPLDANYHQVTDTLANMNETLFIMNTKAIAHAVSLYAVDLDEFPAREAPPEPEAEEPLPRLRRRSRDMSVSERAKIMREVGRHHSHEWKELQYY